MVYGVLSMEYNTDSEVKRLRKDMSIIEVGFIVFSDENPDEPLCTYHTYVKPMLNNGRLYSRVIKSTGITQEAVSNGGLPVQDVVDGVASFIDTYGVKTVYTYGCYGKQVLLWHRSRITGKRASWNKLVGLVQDYQLVLGKGLPATRGENISLPDAMCLYGVEGNGLHSVWADTINLYKLVVTVGIRKRGYDKARFSQYEKYLEARDCYLNLRRLIDNSDAIKADTVIYSREAADYREHLSEVYLGMLRSGESRFVDFADYLADLG